MRYIGRPTLAMIGALLAMTAGCASIRSVEINKAPQHPIQGGIVYYLPTQRLVLTLTVSVEDPCKAAAAEKPKAGDKATTMGIPAACTQEKRRIRKIELAPSPEFADLSARYVAQYRRNQLGSNALALKVNAGGLLSGDGSGATTPAISEFLSSIATLRGSSMSNFLSIRSLPIPLDTVKDACRDPGTYVWSFDVDDPGKSADEKNPKGWVACGIDVTVSVHGPSSKTPLVNGSVNGRDHVVESVQWKTKGMPTFSHGYFYRQKLPFEIRIDNNIGDNASKIFYFPLATHYSPTEFLPIPNTLFANTTWKVGFENGSPTVYDVNAGGDALGLVKLPADIIAAYSDAVLSGLKRQKSITEAEVQSLQQLNALAVQQAKVEACRAAVATGDLDKIKAACQ